MALDLPTKLMYAIPEPAQRTSRQGSLLESEACDVERELRRRVVNLILHLATAVVWQTQ